MKTVTFLLLLTIQNFVFAADLAKQDAQDDCVVDLPVVPLRQCDYQLIQSCIYSHDEEHLSAFLKNNTAPIPQSFAILAEAEKKFVQEKESFRLFHAGGCFGVCLGGMALTALFAIYKPDLVIVPGLVTTLYGIKTAKNIVKNQFYKSYGKQSENIADLLNAHACPDTKK